MDNTKIPSAMQILGSEEPIKTMRTSGEGPSGKLPLTEDMLLNDPSGHLFGLTQNAGMGWNPDDVNLDQYLILSTQGGLSADDGQPIALGYHTGHWEIGLLVKQELVDPETVASLLGGPILFLWEKFSPLVLELRERTIPQTGSNWEYLYYKMNEYIERKEKIPSR